MGNERGPRWARDMCTWPLFCAFRPRPDSVDRVIKHKAWGVATKEPPDESVRDAELAKLARLSTADLTAYGKD